MTEKEVDLQIGKEYNEFYTKVYDGIAAIPAYVTDLFKKALMYVAPAAHQIHADKMKMLIEKKIEELTWVEVGKMVNVITEVPFMYLYTDIDQAVERMMELEQFQVNYNGTVAELDRKMKKKKEVLLNIAGSNGASIQVPTRIAKA